MQKLSTGKFHFEPPFTSFDHLGDAYWRIGRLLEARFQWSHTRDLKPEPEDLVKIEAKLKSGLSDDTAPAAEAEHN